MNANSHWWKDPALILQTIVLLLALGGTYTRFSFELAAVQKEVAVLSVKAEATTALVQQLSTSLAVLQARYETRLVTVGEQGAIKR